MVINGIEWTIKYVKANSPVLQRKDGTYTLGVTDGIDNVVYIAYSLSDYMFTRVLTHELVHCVCFSYGILLDIDTEELIADFMANYGFEVISLVEDFLTKCKIMVE